MTVEEIMDVLRPLVESEGTEDVRTAIDALEAEMLSESFGDSEDEP